MLNVSMPALVTEYYKLLQDFANLSFIPKEYLTSITKKLFTNSNLKLSNKISQMDIF